MGAEARCELRLDGASHEGKADEKVKPFIEGKQIVKIVVVPDKLGAGVGSMVIMNSDGRGARAFVGNEKTPVRWYMVGIVDE